ncbi:hypothetical protein [Saccharopolyspora shandongensis]|uniref:hypothetical protein n=1 Tax=Saccharopolyspora shandongensis TaxID=418495 RepID=UPI0033C1CA99
MEIYPPGAAFIRSEGQTPAECEDSAWAQYQHALDCTDGTGRHDWESRGYRNGAGFCSRCNTVDPQVFTGEQLGQHCRVCQTGTTCHWETDEATGQVSFLCADHCPPLEGPALDDEAVEQLLPGLVESDDGKKSWPMTTTTDQENPS